MTITSGNSFEVELAGEPSAWATENLAADGEAGIPEDPDAGEPGIRESALFGGSYSLDLEVVGSPTGDAIPEPLRYPQGSTYNVTVLADGTTCDALPCAVPVSGLDGGAGSAELADATVALTLGQTIDCFDETDTAVVVPGIGTTTVDVTLTVDDVAYEGGRWVVTSLSGTGEVSAQLTKVCNPTDVLGTSTSAVEATGAAN